MNKLDLIPYPKHCAGSFEETNIIAGVTLLAEFQPQIEAFQQMVRKIYSVDIGFCQGGIELNRTHDLRKNEYRLSCRESIVLSFSEKEGLCYGLATILQLMKKSECAEHFRFPRLEITDYPQYDYRGLLIDVAREEHPFECLLEYVDLCFFFKIKYLQIHFTDAEAFTLPTSLIPKRPEADYFYTKEQISFLNEYAAGKGVLIVPEVEMPGHGGYLVKALREVDSAAVHKNVFCAGWLEKNDIVETLIRELCCLFPDSPYIHIGGDEVETDEWKECPVCTAYCERNQIPSVGNLYSRFVASAAEEVLKNGRRPVVWEGFPKEAAELVPKETVVMVFESLYHCADELVEEGFDIVNASWKPLYVTKDVYWPLVDLCKWDIHEFDNWWERSRAYEQKITIPPTEHLLGCQLCSWDSNYSCEMPIVRRNLAAVSEKGWGPGDFTPDSVSLRGCCGKLQTKIQKFIHD